MKSCLKFILLLQLLFPGILNSSTLEANTAYFSESPVGKSANIHAVDNLGEFAILEETFSRIPSNTSPTSNQLLSSDYKAQQLFGYLLSGQDFLQNIQIHSFFQKLFTILYPFHTFW